MAADNPMKGVCDFLARSWKDKCQGDTASSRALIYSFEKAYSPAEPEVIEDPPMDIKEFPDRYEYVLPAVKKYSTSHNITALVENKNVLLINRTVLEDKDNDVVKYLSKERDRIKGFKAKVTLKSDADTDAISLDHCIYGGALTVTVKKIVPPSKKPKEIHVT